MQELNQLTTLSIAPASQGTELFKGFSSLSNRVRCPSPTRQIQHYLTSFSPFLRSQFTDRFKDGAFENLLSGVKQFLPADKLLPLTEVVEAIMDPAAASSPLLQTTDDYVFLDPKAARSGFAKPKRMAFSVGTAFVVGGASYVEYTNLVEWAGGKAKGATGTAKKITYGSTEIIEPEQFLGVLRSLSRV